LVELDADTARGRATIIGRHFIATSSIVCICGGGAHFCANIFGQYREQIDRLCSTFDLPIGARWTLHSQDATLISPLIAPPVSGSQLLTASVRLYRLLTEIFSSVYSFCTPHGRRPVRRSVSLIASYCATGNAGVAHACGTRARDSAIAVDKPRDAFV